jgi:excisionase family DNA binding protein
MQSVSSTFEPKRKSRREPLKPVSVTINDACKITGLGRTKVYELIAQGTLESVAIGRRRLVLYAAIEALLRPAQ